MNVNRKDDDESRQAKINSFFLHFLPSATRKLNDNKSIVRRGSVQFRGFGGFLKIEIPWFLFEMCPL